MTQTFSNDAATQLASAVSAGATSITVNDASVVPALNNAGDFARFVLIQTDGKGNETDHEIIDVTAVSGDTLTVVRGVEGTTDQDWAVGTQLEMRNTAGTMGRMAQSENYPVDTSRHLEIIADIAEARFAAGLAQESYDDLLFDVFVGTDKLASQTDTVIESQELTIASENAVFITTDDGTNDNVKRLDGADGSVVWDGGGFGINAAYGVDVDGSVIAGGQNDNVEKIDLDGNTVWTFTGHTDWVKSVAVDPNGGKYYSGADDGTVRRIDDTGAEVWQFAPGSEIDALEVDINGFVFAGSGSTFYRLDPADGSEVWSQSDFGTAHGISADEQDESTGFIFVATNSGNITKVAKSDGSQAWRNGEDDSYSAAAEPSSGSVYIGTTNGDIKRHDGDGSSTVISTAHSNRINDLALDAENGFLYTASYDQSAKKIDLSGNVSWTFSHDSAVNGVALVIKSTGSATSTVKSLAYTPAKAFLDTVRSNVGAGGAITVTAKDGSGNTKQLAEGENDLAFADGDVSVDIQIDQNDDGTRPSLDEYGVYWV